MSVIHRPKHYQSTMSLQTICEQGVEPLFSVTQRDWYFIAEQPAPAPHLAHPEGCAALLIVLVTVPRVNSVSLAAGRQAEGLRPYVVASPTHGRYRGTSLIRNSPPPLGPP